jgi:anti-sigma regulatory factor (Ser/Thr protein kinase)
MERKFARTIDALDDVFGFVSEFAVHNGLGDSVAFKLDLAIEELFVNMVKYNPDSHSDILISISKGDDSLVLTLTDFDVEPFDVTAADAYDIGQPLESRPIGSLGIHLVKSIIDEISYEYKDRQSKITLIKNLGKTDVQDRSERG